MAALSSESVFIRDISDCVELQRKIGNKIQVQGVGKFLQIKGVIQYFWLSELFSWNKTAGAIADKQ
jgi:hypothetical protein